MSFTLETIPFSGDTPGASTHLSIYRAGPEDARVKVYLQAALHADEMPGTMLLHHMLPMLRDADEKAQLRARFAVLPMVNPLALAHFSLRRHLGRYDPDSGINHNRRWPDLFAAIGADVALGPDPAANVAAARTAIARWIDAQVPRTSVEAIRLRVLREAHDADYVFDLHCDSDSLIHIFTSPEMMPDLQDLADWIGAAATLVAADSGGGSFDEVLPLFFRRLKEAFPACPLPIASRSATLEYRGRADVFDALGQEDARRLFGFFAGRGLIDAAPGPQPPPMPGATALAATEMLRISEPGLVAYRAELGARVAKGEVVADIIALDGPEAFLKRTPVRAGTDGFVLSRNASKYMPRGASIAKIVGTTDLPGRTGYLLED